MTARIVSGVAAQSTSTLSVHVSEVNSGKKICSATVYLYHPPFALDVAVDYACTSPGGEGDAAELFTPPQGWGVLRSGAGLLLWLRLDSGSLRVDSAAPQAVAEVLRFDFEARPSGATAGVEALSTDVGYAGARAALALDEGLLHPDIGRALHVRFDAQFDSVVKQWLSLVSRRSTAGSLRMSMPL